MADTPVINEHTPVVTQAATVIPVTAPATTAQVANPAIVTPAPPAPVVAPAPKKMFNPPPAPDINITSPAHFRPDYRVNPGPSIAQIAAEYLAEQRQNAQAKASPPASEAPATETEAKKVTTKTTTETVK